MVRPTQKVVYLRACSRIRAKDAEEARARAIGLGNVANETYHLGNVVCSAVCNEGGEQSRDYRDYAVETSYLYNTTLEFLADVCSRRGIIPRCYES